MGSSHSTDNKNPPAAASLSKFSPDYEVIQPKSFDPHYGEIKIVRDKKTGQKMILKESVVNTKQAYEEELKNYNMRVSVGFPNVVNILGYTSEDKHNFCSTHYKISVFIEYIERELLSDLEHRRKDLSPYSEHEILQIADTLIETLSYFQSHGYPHGDIRPFNIFVKDGVYKLSDPTLAVPKGSNALTLAIVNSTKTLLAPELLQQVPHGIYEIKSDKHRADVYSLGITLLSLATLTNPEDLYDYKNGEIQQRLVDDRLDKLSHAYSNFTYETIRSMLNPQYLTRPDFLALYNRIQPYQAEIRSGSALPFARPVRQPQGEVVKKSLAPVQHIEEDHHPITDVYHPIVHTDVDDLDARIKAALDRSEATFRNIQNRDSHNSNTVAAPITTNNYSYTPAIDRTYTLAPTRETERVAKSGAPESEVTRKPDTLSYSTYVPPATDVTYTPKYVEPVRADTGLYTSGYNSTSYNYPYTSTTTYQPTTTITTSAIERAPVTNTITTAAIERSPVVEQALKKSSAPIATQDLHYSTHYGTSSVEHALKSSAPVVNQDFNYSTHYATTTPTPNYTSYSYTPTTTYQATTTTPYTTAINIQPITSTNTITTSAIERPPVVEQALKKSSAPVATQDLHYSTHYGTSSVEHALKSSAPVVNQDLHYSTHYTTTSPNLYSSGLGNIGTTDHYVSSIDRSAEKVVKSTPRAAETSTYTFGNAGTYNQASFGSTNSYEHGYVSQPYKY